jgi:hypothetical protein
MPILRRRAARRISPKKSGKQKYQVAWRNLRNEQRTTKVLIPIGAFQFFLLCGVACHAHATCYQAELMKWAEEQRGKSPNPGHVAGALKILAANRFLKHRMAPHPTARRKDVNLYSLTRRGQLVLELIIQLLDEEEADMVH